MADSISRLPADAQFVIAREHGFESWAELKHCVGAIPAPRMEQYEQIARDLAVAHMRADAKAVRDVNWNYSTAFVADFHDPLMMQQRLTTWFASGSRTPALALADAGQMVAHSYGLQSWESLMRASRNRSPTRPPPCLSSARRRRSTRSILSNGAPVTASQALDKQRARKPETPI
jgi:hypothetical protein